MRSTIYTQFKIGIRVLTAMLLLGMHFNVSAQKTELPAEARNIPNYRDFWANEPFAKYDRATELLEKRDQVSKHFRNADGTITAHIASGPINYLEDGQWKTIYHTIEPSANGGFKNTYNSFRTHYPATASGEIVTVLPDGTEMRDMQGMRMYYEANGQAVGTMNIANTPGSVDFNKLTYSGVYGSQIDLRLTQNSTQRKMDYILQNASALNTAPSNAQFLVFEEKITLPEGTVAKLENNVIHLYQYGNIIAQYTNPYITERTNSQYNDITENAVMSVTMDALRETNNIEEEASGENGMYEGKYEIVQTGNELTVKLKVEMTWLLDASRTFPIEVDPTTNYSVDGSAYSCAYSTLRPGNSTCSAVTDATGEFYVGRNSDVGGQGSNDRWIDSYNRFDISSLPSSSAVSNATVFFTMHNITSTNGLGTMALYKMDYNQTTNSCPNFYNNITTTAYSAAFSGTNTSNNAGAHNLALNATGVADLQAKVGTNWFALAYRPTGTYSSASRWRTMRGRSQAAKPYIAVTYTPPWRTTWVSMDTGASTWCAGETRNVTVTVTNAGASTWTNSAPLVRIGVKWNGDADYFVRTNANGLVSGATQTYTLTVTAPNAGGTNNLSFDVVNEGNFWFATNSNGAGPGNVVYTSAQITINSPPTVTTTTASAVANFTATSGGNVTATGGSSVTARGVLWGITPGLTMPSASSTSDGAGTGSFTSSITGLSASTIYYYRAYAQNCSGYGYGPEKTFVTTGPAAEGFYISGNILNNGEIISTFDENYLRLTGTSKTITGSGKFTNSKLFADGSITFDAGLVAESAFTETFVNAGKSLTIATGKTFKNGTMANYGTLTITGTGIINNTSNWFNGATGTVTFGGAGTITAGANWTNDGTFTAGTGTVEFNGSDASTIGGSGANNFYKLTMNKGNAEVVTTLASALNTVTHELILTSGILDIAAYNLDMQSLSISGGTSNSYVNTSGTGTLNRNVGNSAVLFPVGRNSYTPATLTNSGTADNYNVRVIDNVTDDGTAVGAQTTMAVVNRTWMINEQVAGGSNVTLTLGWNPGQSEEINAFDASTAFIAHYMADEGLWDNIGGTVQSTGVIQTGGITSFSPFTVSSDGAFAPLPITLSFFDGTCNPEGNELTWVTSSEQNSSHFDLKRSYDGIKWEHVGQKQGAGNSSTDIEYSVWDVEGSRYEVTYYELHQFDFDNALTVYGPIAVRCENDDSPMNGTLSPNPTIEASYLAIENCPLGEATITLMSSIGQVIYTDRIMVTKKNDVYFIDSFDLTRGSYVVRFQASNGQIVAMKLVKN